jgi:hypothetical protein
MLLWLYVDMGGSGILWRKVLCNSSLLIEAAAASSAMCYTICHSSYKFEILFWLLYVDSGGSCSIRNVLHYSSFLICLCGEVYLHQHVGKLLFFWFACVSHSLVCLLKHFVLLSPSRAGLCGCFRVKMLLLDVCVLGKWL